MIHQGIKVTEQSFLPLSHLNMQIQGMTVYKLEPQEEKSPQKTSLGAGIPNL